MKVLLLLKEGLRDSAVSKEVSFLKDRGFKVRFKVKKPDITLTIGGDGTFFRACREVESPILPLVHGSYGYHCSGELKNLEPLIDRFLYGDCHIREYPLLEASMGNEKRLAACDVLFAGKALGPALHMSLRVDAVASGRFIADGAVVYSYFGASGYNLALGGPLVAKEADVMGISFVNPHNAVAKSYILSGNSQVSIEKAIPKPETKIVIDGIQEYPANQVKIRISEKKSKVIRFAPDRLLMPAQH